LNRRNRLHGVGTENNAFGGDHHDTTIAVKKEVTTLFNILTVGPEDHARLVEL
jgi:hypothetical protein